MRAGDYSTPQTIIRRMMTGPTTRQRMNNDSICTPKDPSPKPELEIEDEVSEEGVHVPLAPYYTVSTPASSVHSSGRESLQDVAMDAVSHQRPSLGDGVLPERESLRDNIRLIHVSIQQQPYSCDRKPTFSFIGTLKT